MPRSARASSKPSASQRKARKRSTSRQTKCYPTLESPSSSKRSRLRCRPRQVVEVPPQTAHDSPSSSNRDDQTLSVSSSTLSNDCDSTPTPNTSACKESVTKEPEESSVPGFEVLEAVSELYQKLKASQAETIQVRGENERLLELIAEKDKLLKVQNMRNQEGLVGRTDAEEHLRNIGNWLRSYGAAASKIIPLLDILTGAADIEYDEAAENLYRFVREG